MRLTKFGHSCLLVEEGGARVLLDPGSFSEGFEELDGLTAVCLTHQHGDHLDAERLRRVLDRNPGVRVVSDEGSAPALGEAGADVEVVHDGDELDLGGLGVAVAGRDHAVIHPDIPVVPNVGYLVGGRLFHPGDAFTLPGRGAVAEAGRGGRLPAPGRAQGGRPGAREGPVRAGHRHPLPAARAARGAGRHDLPGAGRRPPAGAVTRPAGLR